MGKAGRPPLEPRIAKLEREVEELKRTFTSQSEFIAKLNPHNKPVRDNAYSDLGYRPQFERWPGNER